MSVEDRLAYLLWIDHGFSRDQIQPEKTLYGDLALDSLEMTELMMSIEAEFSIEIDPEAWVKVQTFGEIVTLVGEVLSQKALFDASMGMRARLMPDENGLIPLKKDPT